MDEHGRVYKDLLHQDAIPDLPEALERALLRWERAENVQSLLSQREDVLAALNFVMDKFAAPKLLELGHLMVNNISGFNFVFEDRTVALRVVARLLSKAKKHTFYLPCFVAELEAYHQPWSKSQVDLVVPRAEAAFGVKSIFCVMFTLPDNICAVALASFGRSKPHIGELADELRAIVASLLRSPPPTVPDMYTVSPAGRKMHPVFDIPPLFKRQCVACGARASREKPLLRCTRCHGAHYCNTECQVADWPRHEVEECAGLRRLVSLSEATSRELPPRQF